MLERTQKGTMDVTAWLLWFLNSKWASIARCSPDTALRDINDLLARGVLIRTGGGGRSTNSELVDS